MSARTHRGPAAGARPVRYGGLIALMLLGGCASALLPRTPAPPQLFALSDSAPTATPTLRPPESAPTLIVNGARAAAGYETQRIVYMRQPHQIQYFAAAQWVDAPAHMIMPLAARAIERTGAFRAVVRAPSAAAGELRLDIELIRLQQEFIVTPSRVRITLRAALLDAATRRVVDWREFDASVTAPSDDPYGGVIAANEAVQQVLLSLAAFCAEAAGH